MLKLCGRRKNGFDGRGEEKKPTPSPKRRITAMDSVKKREERIQVFCIHYSVCVVKRGHGNSQKKQVELSGTTVNSIKDYHFPMQNRIIYYIRNFVTPVIVLAGLLLYLTFSSLNIHLLMFPLAITTIIIGSYKLVVETYEDIRSGKFGLDYIAILAVIVSVATGEYIVGIILALMIASGRNLEEYGAKMAKRSLTELSERIPHDVMVEKGTASEKKAVKNVTVGEVIIIRKGEVVPLDGEIISEESLFDEQSLTGEAFPVEKLHGDFIRSGVINVGTIARIKVLKEQKDSSYSKIIEIVERAQSAKAPLVRLADKYSVYFTIVTFVIAAFSFMLHGTLESILAVLVVATPCPLILATPIALLGGMNAQARKRIIIKHLSSLESLSRVDTVVFDKTGTITLGKPKVSEFKLHTEKLEKGQALAIAVAIERNSLHPLASAVVEYGKSAVRIPVSKVRETIGKGIQGSIDGKDYILKKTEMDTETMEIGLYQDEELLASFIFEDEVKTESRSIIEKLKNMKMNLFIFTGDKLQTTQKLVEKLQIDMKVRAELKPEDKQKGIEELKNSGAIVAMVGDGINDAPALALSDVGMVFANEEKTAASEASDIVLLGGNFSSVLYSLLSARRTISIAKQSIVAGIGMSVVCMILASFGLISPIVGAVIQEGIDVAVILNALRASKS